MTLGLGVKAKPCAVNVGDSEVLIAKDSQYPLFILQVLVAQLNVVDFGVFVGTDGKQSRPNQIEWPATPEDLGKPAPVIVINLNVLSRLAIQPL